MGLALERRNPSSATRQARRCKKVSRPQYRGRPPKMAFGMLVLLRSEPVSIQKISTLHRPTAANTFISNIRAKQSAAFSIEAHLPQTSAKDVQPSPSQITAVLPQVRQSATTPQTKSSEA